MRADQLHRIAQLRLQRTVGAAVAGTLLVVTLERSDAVRSSYADTTARLVSAGQRATANLAVAYMRAYVPPVKPVDLNRALAPTLMTPDSDGAIVGLLRLWHLLDDNTSEHLARQAAGSFAANLAEGDLQVAMRAGLDEGARAAERRPRWRKELTDDPCEWCRMIADSGARYNDADSVPFHQSDHCAVAPDFEE